MTRAPENDRIVEMLRRLGQGTPMPEIDPKRERDLLSAFDAAMREPRSPARRWPVFVAAALAAAATAVISVAYRGSHPATAPLSATEFVLWPDAAELPTFESGHLMRVEMPASVATELGLTPAPSADGIARADILVGQDGLPRAVRLVNDF